MESNNNKKMERNSKEIRKYKASIISVVMMIILLCAAVFCHLYVWKDAPFQFLAACLGAGVTVIITNLLLVEQDDRKQEQQEEHDARKQVQEQENILFQEKLKKGQEERKLEQEKKLIEIQEDLKRKAEEDNEKRNKDLQLRDNKIKAYSDFISGMYTILNKPAKDIDNSDLERIRMDIFSKLIFYIDPSTLKELSELSQDIQEAGINNSSKLFENLSSITSLLRDEIRPHEDEDDTAPQMINIWKNMSIKTEAITDKESLLSYSNTNLTFWHFNMLGDEQIDAFKKELYELSLIEYNGETWRTNLLQQVKSGDIVFLFRRGGWGYIGAFMVEGWRVFYNDNNVHREIKSNNDELDIDVEKDIERFDIYCSISDGATSCANLIVKPLAFDYEGVSYPGGVYRRTISRYDKDYARELLSRFVANKNKLSYNRIWDEKDGQKGYITKVNSDTTLFDKIITEMKIKPAEKDKSGNWLN